MPTRFNTTPLRVTILQSWPVLFFLLGFAAPWSHAEEPKVLKEKRPAWVSPVPVDFEAAPPKGGVSDGRWFLLLDTQMNAATNARYEHTARKLLSENGVQENSRISLSFDPSYETLTLNQLLVHRRGQAIDRLASQEVKLLQREQSLDRHIYDGRISAVLILEDIQIGDVVEYAYTIRGANPIFGGKYFHSFEATWNEPVHQMRVRLLWPNERKLFVKATRPADQPSVTVANGVAEYLWRSDDTEPVLWDDDTPTWFSPYQSVDLTEYPDWSSVARWASSILPVSTVIPDELNPVIDRIRSLPTAGEQALAALRYVQSEFRYLGIEVGAHSHEPYPIATVVQRRFGDCKDKALLLCAILRKLNLDAAPALLNTEDRGMIANWLPTPMAFNHAVVQLRMEGKTYWLDATESNQGGALKSIYFPAYGKALVVRDDTKALEDVPGSAIGESATEITESYEVKDYKNDVTLHVNAKYRGRSADDVRSFLADTPPPEVEKMYLNHYAKQYPEIQVAQSPHFSDDLAKNEIIGEYDLRIAHFWQPKDGSSKLFAEFYPQAVRDRIAQPSTRIRSMPYVLRFPENIKEVIKIHFPSSFPLRNENVTVENAAFHFHYSKAPKGNSVTLTHSYKNIAESQDPKGIGKYLSDVQKVLDEIGYEVSIPKSLAEGGSAASGVMSESNAVASSPKLSHGAIASTFTSLIFGLGAGYYVGSRNRRRLPSPVAQPVEYLHQCVICGKTDLSDPGIDFRVGKDGHDYCVKHIGGARRSTLSE